jgi:hypothetical protein
VLNALARRLWAGIALLFHHKNRNSRQKHRTLNVNLLDGCQESRVFFYKKNPARRSQQDLDTKKNGALDIFEEHRIKRNLSFLAGHKTCASS